MVVPRSVWWLPRPKKSKFKGGVPLHFEKKLMNLLGNPEMILQPFGGDGEYGLKVDISRNYCPDVIADAHNLPFRDNSFDLVLLDPPYSNQYAHTLYGTGELHFTKYTSEAVRVAKPNGFIVVYHYYLSPRLCRTSWYHLLVIVTRIFHKARIVSIFRKEMT
jgi:SAM-dependent methyltransferase